MNVVVVSCLNELSLLSGLLAAFFRTALFSGLLLSCHIVVLLLLFQVNDHKILYFDVSCGLERTAHNILLYKP